MWHIIWDNQDYYKTIFAIIKNILRLHFSGKRGGGEQEGGKG